jgi:hypothetical protein
MRICSFLIIGLLIFLALNANAQQKDKPSTLYTRISVPVWVDMTEGANFSDPKREDFEKTWTNNVFDIYIDLNRVPIDSDGHTFNGVFESTLMPFGKYSIRGTVSTDHSMLTELRVTKNVEYEKDGYQEIEKWTVEIKDMPLVNGIGQLSKEKTKVTVTNFENSITTTTTSRVEYKNYVFKSVDEDKILPPPYGGRFVLNINVDGPPTYTINITDVRGPDSTWEPPAATVNPDYFVKEIEPNSIAIYQDKLGLQISYADWTKIFAFEIMHQLVNTYGLKVLERIKKEHIISEIDLSESGLVKEQSEISKGSLMREEVAVIVRVDLPGGIATVLIQSRKGEKKITVQNLTEQNREFALYEVKKKTIRIANSYLRDKLIPATFYQ